MQRALQLTLGLALHGAFQVALLALHNALLPALRNASATDLIRTEKRMPVITIAQSKGGAGKSTLALAIASEFAAYGGSVVILDADRQHSLLNWFVDRQEEGVDTAKIVVRDVSQIPDDQINKAIDKAKGDAQLVIIDSEGTANFKTAYGAMDSDYVVIPTRSSRLDLERTVETKTMLSRMCPSVPYKVLITQTGMVARSKAEWEIDNQIRETLPTFDVQMHTLDGFRAMSNYRRTLEEVEAESLAKTDRPRQIAQHILREILEDINKAKGD